MKIQLWSSHYDPEPTGIAPISATWAEAMVARGHSVDVVASHPRYPDGRWGSKALPYRERRNGIPIFRAPFAASRRTLWQRIKGEVGFLGWLFFSLPFLGTSGKDVLISVTPSFPALMIAMLATRIWRVPWVVWVQDILPDGAASTGYLNKRSPLFMLAKWLEMAAYQSAELIFVISPEFERNLIEKGVPEAKVSVVLNPATLPVRAWQDSRAGVQGPPRILWMGNVGRSQGLVEIVRAFQANEALAQIDARLVITGTGVALEEVAAAAESDRIELAGVVSRARLEEELARAWLGAVTQSHDGAEFNLPSKLMNYLAVGLPVLASVDLDGGVARLLEESGGGWVTDQRNPALFAKRAAELLTDPDTREEASRLASIFASDKLSAAAHARLTEQELTKYLREGQPQVMEPSQ